MAHPTSCSHLPWQGSAIDTLRDDSGSLENCTGTEPCPFVDMPSARFLTAMAQLSSCDGDHRPGSEKPLLSGPLQRPPTAS